MYTPIETTKCLFCDGHIPASYDQVYINHMNDHHRAFVNIEFLFQISLLGVNDLDSLDVDHDLNLSSKSNFTPNESTRSQPSVNEIKNEYRFNDKISNSISIIKLDGEKSERSNIKIDENEEELQVKGKKEHLKLQKLTKEKKSKNDWKKILGEAEKKKGMSKIDKRKRIKTECKCDIKFESERARVRHVRIVHKKYFGCDICKDGVFKKQEDYVTHLTKQHPAFPNLPRNRDRSNICDDCGFVVSHWRKMHDHKALKHDNTLYQCEVCSASIRGRRSFQRHTYRHENPILPKECPECKKIVTNMRFHRRKMHLKSELKSFECKDCDKRFAFARDLKNHVVTHSDLRPFICRFGCGFGSKTAGNRTKHEVNKHNAKSEKETKSLIDSGVLQSFEAVNDV